MTCFFFLSVCFRTLKSQGNHSIRVVVQYFDLTTAIRLTAIQ